MLLIADLQGCGRGCGRLVYADVTHTHVYSFNLSFLVTWVEVGFKQAHTNATFEDLCFLEDGMAETTDHDMCLYVRSRQGNIWLVCACVCERERERERLCVCVCVLWMK